MTITRLPSPGPPEPPLPDSPTPPLPARPQPNPTTRRQPSHVDPDPTTLPVSTRPTPALPYPTARAAPPHPHPTQPDAPIRDYAAEMRAVIDAETGDAPYTSVVVAEHIVTKLKATDPALLDGWLHAQAVNFLRHAINLRDCSARSHARVTAGRSVFREAAESGDVEALTQFLDVRYVVDDANTRTRLADMGRQELLFAADAYKRRAAESLIEETFLRLLAKKVGTRKVADVFDEEKLATAWRSITAADS